MRDSFEYCDFCNEMTWLKITDYKCERVNNLCIDTHVKDGVCKHCGRRIYIVAVKAIEDEPETGEVK
jgi:hypothetical protein